MIMVNIARYNPRINALDDVFRGFFMSPMRFEEQPEVQIKMDVREEKKDMSSVPKFPVSKRKIYKLRSRATRFP
jgi:HSP20 family protein